MQLVGHPLESHLFRILLLRCPRLPLTRFQWPPLRSLCSCYVYRGKPQHFKHLRNSTRRRPEREHKERNPSGKKKKNAKYWPAPFGTPPVEGPPFWALFCWGWAPGSLGLCCFAVIRAFNCILCCFLFSPKTRTKHITDSSHPQSTQDNACRKSRSTS